MSAVLALLVARKAGARVFTRDGRLVVQSQGQLPPDVLEDLRTHRDALAQYLTLQRQPSSESSTIEKRSDPAVAELLEWFAEVDLPNEPFHLWPWARVIDPATFYAALRQDVDRGPSGQRWNGALEDLRQLRRFFADRVDELQEAA